VIAFPRARTISVELRSEPQHRRRELSEDGDDAVFREHVAPRAKNSVVELGGMRDADQLVGIDREALVLLVGERPVFGHAKRP
jgi:hypothetical protein